ncbi:MAG: hypothetical protein JWO36_4096 [Myxococcales bacterium]|nr:hypothetical protein [Myxococcales bacterium]
MVDEPSDEHAGDRPPRTWLMIMVAGVVLGAGGAAIIYLRWASERKAEEARGQPAGAVIVAGELVLVDRVAVESTGTATYRLTALDPRTGFTANTRVLGDIARCSLVAGDRMQCARSSGNRYYVEVPSLQINGPSERGPGKELGCDLADEALVGDDHLAFGPGTMRPLVRHVPHDPTREPVAYTLPGTPSFISPAFLRVGEPSPLLVLHDVAIDRPNHVQLTRVAADLRTVWTVELVGRCETASLLGSRLVITTHDPKHRAFGIDLETGKIAWHFAL